MKWIAFGAFILVGVPCMTALAGSSKRGRWLLMAALIASTVVKVSVNFASLEDYRGPDRGFEVSLADLIALSLGLGLVIRCWRKVVWFPANTLLYAAYLGIATIAFTQAHDQQLAAFTLFKWMKTTLLYWVVFNTFWCEWPMSAAAAGIMGAGAIETFIGFKQKYLYGMYRINGTFDHSNTIPAYFVIIIPILLCWLMAQPRARWVQLSATGAVLGMGFVVAATMSRAGLVLLGATIVASLAYAMFMAPSRGKLGFAAFFALLFLAGGVKAMDSFIDRFMNAPESSEEARDEFNIAADLMARDNPFGVGINCFSRVLTEDARYRDSIHVMENEEHAGVCHHIYKLTAAEMGYGGLIVFALMLAHFLFLAARHAFTSAREESFILFGALVGFTALHLVGLLEWVFRVTPVWNLFWIVSALTAATAWRMKRGIYTPVSEGIPALA